MAKLSHLSPLLIIKSHDDPPSMLMPLFAVQSANFQISVTRSGICNFCVCDSLHSLFFQQDDCDDFENVDASKSICSNLESTASPSTPISRPSRHVHSNHLVRRISQFLLRTLAYRFTNAIADALLSVDILIGLFPRLLLLFTRGRCNIAYVSAYIGQVKSPIGPCPFAVSPLPTVLPTCLNSAGTSFQFDFHSIIHNGLVIITRSLPTSVITS